MQPTAAPQLGATHWPTAFRSWMDRPAPSWTIALCIMALLALPCWLLGDQLRHFCLAGDDFAYVADSRDASRLASNLFKPHNTHIVPLFRIWTFALVKAAGRLSNFATALGVGSYLTFSLSLLAIRHLVVRVTRSQAAGLIAMAMLGLSTVMESVVVWYSAGQALCAGTSIVASLIAIESWLSQGKVWSLAMAVAASLAAPGIWMGGLVAGPAAAAYLWFAGRRTSKRAAVAFLMVSVCLAGLLLASVSNEMQRLSQPADRRTGTAAKALESVRSTCMAIPETLVFRNLGIDAPLTAPQGLVICLAIAWFWLRGGLRRPNRFEAAGAVLVVGSYLMVYFFRGYMAYEHMRVVGWYNAIPEIGAILFVAGWWAHWRGSDPAEPTAQPSRWTFRSLMAVVSVTCCLLVLHLPRAARLFVDAAPRMTEEEAALFPTPELQRLRAVAYADEHAIRQQRALSRLEGAEQTAEDLGIGRMTIRQTFGRVLVPGIPELQRQSDAAALLALPEGDRRSVDQATVRESLRRYMFVEPEFRPPWLTRARASQPAPFAPAGR